MVRTREQQADMDRSMDVITAEIEEFQLHKEFFNDEAYDLASVDEIETRLDIIKVIKPAVAEVYKATRILLDEVEKEALKTRVHAFYNDHLNLVTKIKTYLRTLELRQKTDEAVPTPVSLHKSSLKTPKVELPEFNGAIESWTHFRDMFLSLVHNNNSLDDIQKFHFLRMSMKLPTSSANVLDSFNFVAENYQAAWAAVCKRFNDKRKIVKYHMKTLFNIKKAANGSSTELRKIIDAVSSSLSSLAQQGFTLDECNEFGNLFIVFIVTERLDDETLKEWRKDYTDDFPSWSDLHGFLDTMQRSLDDQQYSAKLSSKPTEFKKTKAFVSGSSLDKPLNNNCQLCSEPHKLYRCEQFVIKNVSERFQFVKEKRLCHNCLSSGHVSKDCRSSNCKTCGQKHHTLLHFETKKNVQPASNMSPSVQPFVPLTFNRQPSSDAHTSATSLSANVFKANCQTMLSTVSIYVADKSGEWHIGRALLDSGSDSSFMTTTFAKRLGLKLENAVTTITGISEKAVLLKHCTRTIIKSRYNEYQKSCVFSIMPNITGNLPTYSVSFDKFGIPDEYVHHLADPHFNQSGPIDMLLDNSVFWECLMDGSLQIPNGPLLKSTRFGWLIGGEIKFPSKTSSTFLSCYSSEKRSGDTDLDVKLDRFFSSEDVDCEKPVLTAEEQYCEDLYGKTTTQGEDGKYIVRMPFKTSSCKLGKNLNNAIQQSYRLDAKRKRDETYDKLYTEYVNELISSGYITQVEPPTVDQEVHYLPHHGVLKMSSTSTKLRPVFNASSKSETGISLNDVLCVGPTVQSELIELLMRFRERKYIVMGDITKMFLQIWVDSSQRDFMRIVWRPKPNEPLQHFRLNTVTFGTACAPYLATRTVQQIANDNEMEFPEAAKVIRNSFYVDDLLYGTDSVKEAIQVITHVRYLLSKAGMSLCKIVSNDAEIIKEIPISKQHPVNKTNETLKALGIIYEPLTDKFSFQMKPMLEGPSTKASVLSNIASIFDPMGWLGPVVLTAKLIMKQLWMQPMKWTDEIPAEQQDAWDDFREHFSSLNDVVINRRCIIDNPVNIDLHGFCDASIVGYGAVIYALSIDREGNRQVTIICAKSRVAPKSQKTLARLELCSAVLLSKLIAKVVSSLSITINKIHLWSDSMIVLQWILITPSKLQTYVGNRVACIQELTQHFTWRHIRGIDNPADKISRGLMPREIQHCKIWWNGPSFFELPESKWPSTLLTVSTDDPEVKLEMKRTLIVSPLNDMFVYVQTRFSRHRTLINVIAFIKRFATNSRLKKNNKQLSNIASIEPLTIDEIDSARFAVVRVIQQQLFSDEYSVLSKYHHNSKTTKQIAKKSSLKSLSPFLDKNGIIRVGGRLDACPELSYDQKHQIILPQCPFTTVIIRDLHLKHLHAGPSALMSFVKNQFWPLRAKSTIRKVIHECMTCFRVKPKDTSQFMSDLPAARVTLTKPFTNTAVDYAGFYLVRAGTTRNAPQSKCYVSLFKCMCTGAIHLELVSDLSTHAFIAALDRFSSRRGKPSYMYSDNGTCFQGCDRELKNIIEKLDPIKQQYCVEQAIQWKFTTPRAPHAGGIYESGIKSMKFHLKRIMSQVYNFEQFTTILCKVEAILNSRPLTPISDDPADLQILTPGHFLIGGPLNSIPQRDLSDAQSNRLKAWEGLQRVQQKFWHLWYHDYLHQLQERPAKFRDIYQFKIGEMVLLKDQNLPPMKWLMGRITKLYPSSKDKVVRNVQVNTKNGVKDRHVKYLCLLPLDIEEPPSPPGSVFLTEN